MVVVHDLKEEDQKLRVDYTQLLGDWVEPLKDYLNSEFQTRLMYFINRRYSRLNLNNDISFSKKDLFKAWKLSSYDKTKVCIINMFPEFNKKSTPLAFGEKVEVYEDHQSHEMIDLFNQIEHFQDDDFKLDKDYTLESWAKQGVLLLNFGLFKCTDVEKINFFNLLRHTIVKLSDKTGIIFCFINNKHGYFKESVDPRLNTIINSEKLDYKLLEQVNNEIEKSNGKEFRIRW